MYRLTVLNPKVFQDIPAIKGSARLACLKGATIGFVDNSKQNADLFIERLRALLHDRYGIAPGVKVRKHVPERDFAELAKCSAVVQCYGD